MANYRLILQTTDNENVESADLDAALALAATAAADSIGSRVHGRVEYKVFGISPQSVANRNETVTEPA